MKRQRFTAGLLSALLTLSMAGCGQASAQGNVSKSGELPGAYENEILTTDAIDANKTVITVRIENGIGGQRSTLEEALEAKFPNVDIVLRHDGAIASTLKANLQAGVACDLILSRRLNTLGESAQDYLLDLSAESFVDNYYITAIDSCLDAAGKLYFLPGPSDYYGIVYDKTMFEENGWQVPHSYSEFVELLNTIRAAGLTASVKNADGNTETTAVEPYMLSIMYPDAFQIQFNTYGYEAAFGGMDNYRWLTAYQKGEGSAVGHLESAVDKFKQLFADGIISEAAWTTAPKDRSNALYVNHTAAMIAECQSAITYNESFTQAAGIKAHEIAMMPFWTSDEPDSDYLYVIPSYYMGINKAAAEESADKKALLLDILAYLSSEEGQQAMLSDTLQISNVQGVPMQDDAFTTSVLDTISEGRLINTFYLAVGEDNKQVERQMLSTAADMLAGTISVKDWLLGIDQARDTFLAGDGTAETIYGQAESTLTRLETAYTVAEMYREMTEADIGLCHGGVWRGGTNGYIYQGSITDASLSYITPNKEPSQTQTDPMEERIVVAEMTGQQVLDILNSKGSSDTTVGECPYYVASGLTVRFDPWAEEGSRVLSCKLPDGSDIDPDATYQVAYFNGSLPAYTAVKPYRALEKSWEDVFIEWLKTQDQVIKQPEMTIELAYNAKS
jgi:hypothetical protein